MNPTQEKPPSALRRNKWTRRFKRIRPESFSLLWATLRRRLEPLLGKLALGPGNGMSFGPGPVLLAVDAGWDGSMAPLALESLAHARNPPRPLILYLKADCVPKVRDWMRANTVSSFEILERPGRITHGMPASPGALWLELRAEFPRLEASLAGCMRSWLLFHPEWLRALEGVADALRSVKQGLWCASLAPGWDDVNFASRQKVLANAECGAEGPSGGLVILERGGPACLALELAPSPFLPRGWAHRLAAASGMIRPYVAAPAESYVDDLAFYRARFLKEPCAGANPAHQLRALGWDRSDLERIIPYNYYRTLGPDPAAAAPLDGIEKPVPIDLVFLAVPKDLKILPWTLKAARLYVDHPVRRTMIIGPKLPEIEAFCRQEGCEFVDENEVSPLPRREIKYFVDGRDRSSWIFQQFLKYNASTRVSQDHYMIIDADTVLLRRQRFGEEGHYRLRCSDEFHLPYFKIFQALTGEGARTGVAFTAHHMLFSVEILRRLEARMQETTGLPWWEAILRHLDPKEMSSISDYESYGCWVRERESCRTSVMYWRNIALPRVGDEHMPEVLAWAAKNHDSASFHHHHG